MKTFLFSIFVFLGLAVNAQTSECSKTIMSFESKFDTLRQVGYPYNFGLHNKSEYGNAIDFGKLIFTKAKVNIVSNCVYETYFDNAIVKSLSLATDNKKTTAELREFASLVCSDFVLEDGCKGPINLQAKIFLNEKLCLVSYTEDKHSKNAIFEVKLSDEVLN